MDKYFVGHNGQRWTVFIEYSIEGAWNAGFSLIVPMEFETSEEAWNYVAMLNTVRP